MQCCKPNDILSVSLRVTGGQRQTHCNAKPMSLTVISVTPLLFNISTKTKFKKNKEKYFHIFFFHSL